ncbi:MAG: GNAT family N-acetyltransferase [Cyclobacteriaceae bacterium]
MTPLCNKGRVLFLSKIYVLKEYRGKGIGKAGMSFVQAQSEKLGFHSITLTVNKYNTTSIVAYERLGFQKVESIVVDIGEGFVMDDYVMKKQIVN